MAFARTEQLEILDRLAEHASASDVSGNLRDIRRANRWLGGTRAIVTAMMPLLESHRSDTPLSILDVATGSADIPLEIAGCGVHKSVEVQITATDIQLDVLAVARVAEQSGRIRIEQADARELPYDDASFDVVSLALALHHFEPDNAIRVLREMRRVARLALIVSDLERSWMGYVGAWLVGHLLTTNRLTRNDAPLSVRRAYTVREALALAHAAGWHGSVAQRTIPFRYVLTGRPA